MTAKSTRSFYAFGQATANNFPLAVRAFAGTANAQSSAATLAANKGPGRWYADSDSLRYSFFDKVETDED